MHILKYPTISGFIFTHKLWSTTRNIFEMLENATRVFFTNFFGGVLAFGEDFLSPSGTDSDEGGPVRDRVR